MASIEQPTILVIVGVSGDLAQRKLLPALREIKEAGFLPPKFRIVGVSRRTLKVADVLPAAERALHDLTETYCMDLSDPDHYKAFKAHLAAIEKQFGAPAQRLYYLSVPPQVTQHVVELMGEAGLLQHEHDKLLLEKPFGTDLASAEDLVSHLKTYCREEQLYRIDHYLAKEMAQNLVVFRAGNALFKETWNNKFIERVDIIASEKIGIEDRVAFYEQTGALRDFVQSHLLQLAALVLMELPAELNWETVPKYRLRALESIEPPADVASQVVRGQYRTYRKEVGNPHSSVETYVSLCLYSRDPRWEGVPIHLTTGKKLDQRKTEIRIRYRQASGQANELVFHIQPNEGVTLCLGVKQPGYEHGMQQLPLQLDYDSHFADLPEAYERVFVDAMRSEHALFTTSDEVLASWRILAPIQHAWSMSADDLTMYEPGHPPAKA